MAYLLKFLLCTWRHQSGGKGVFDGLCREKMRKYGVDIDSKGTITIDKSGKFADTLFHVGIEVPEDVSPLPPREGKATSRVWSCGCQRVRVGTKEFFAACTRCNQPFRPGDHVGKTNIKANEQAETRLDS